MCEVRRHRIYRRVKPSDTPPVYKGYSGENHPANFSGCRKKSFKIDLKKLYYNNRYLSQESQGLELRTGGNNARHFRGPLDDCFRASPAKMIRC
ncbi:hypothetical protein NPIL_43201 [Nephila pilipes]|uniref:Uncharacterized protein n=1 Tax=Nephila pilipes TaxID=299642 RepID=A0A8X6QG41_NEPPI|nr:hypothetical protein NPIL_43201 [Nephila pilipes]